MNQNKSKIFRNVAITIVIAAIAGFTSCEKYIWDPPTYEPPDTTDFDTIYYDTDVAPLFPANNCSNCHKNGGVNPNLTPDNSYDALINGNYVNTLDPPSSKIVTKIQSGHMGGMSFDDTKIIIDWIYQGAENYSKQ